MARKSGSKSTKGERQPGPAGRGKADGEGGRIKREKDTSQLLERGEGPSEDEVLDPEVDSPSEITSEGGPATDASYRGGVPRSRGRNPPNERSGGTGGEGGYSTLGGGVYPDEGDPDDAPSYGDWQRHSSGGTSGARGQEGYSYPGEHTWGEAESKRERQEEQRGGNERRIAQRRRPDAVLAQELLEILTKDPELDATEIEVEVEGGAVSLTGTVDSTDARLLAEELVESVTGVREVHNHLKVAR
jgi:osmotically-inducible protein OsmY